MNITAQAQHIVNRMHGLGRMAHYQSVDYECRMPISFHDLTVTVEIIGLGDTDGIETANS